MNSPKSKQLEYYYKNKDKIQARQKIYFKKYYEDNKQYFKKYYQSNKDSESLIVEKEVKPSVIFTIDKIEVSLD